MALNRVRAGINVCISVTRPEPVEGRPSAPDQAWRAWEMISCLFERERCR